MSIVVFIPDVGRTAFGILLQDPGKDTKMFGERLT